MKALRRTSIGALDLSSACLLEDLSWEKALGLDTLFPERIYELHDEQIYTRLRDGQRIRADFSFPQDKEIFLSDGKNIRYVVEYKGDILHPRKKVT